MNEGIGYVFVKGVGDVTNEFRGLKCLTFLHEMLTSDVRCGLLWQIVVKVLSSRKKTKSLSKNVKNCTEKIPSLSTENSFQPEFV